MADLQSGSRGQWGSRLAFVLAASGSAVGLGNIWKFPYITGTNGGGAFVLIYLLCIVVVGFPILVAEIYVGKEAQTNAVQAFDVTHGKKSNWKFIGFLGIISAFVILSFYSVVGGWVMDYEYRSLMNQFAGKSDEEIKGLLGALFASPWRLLFWHALFMALTIGIVAGGITKGIERWTKILMPILCGLLLILFVYSFFLDGFGQAMEFLFYPDFSKLTWEGVLEAVGHSFFTLSLGMGAMITYGSYLSEKEDIAKTAFTVGFLDTIIALIAGTVIFSVVFTYDQPAAAGPSLMFITLPMLFKEMVGGYIISVAFFLLVAFAALTSAISLLEVVTAYWVETKKWSRKATSITIGVVIWALGILSALSFNVLSDVKFLDLGLFDLFDKSASSVFLPVGGLFISLFFGWVLGPKAVQASLQHRSSHLFFLLLLWCSRIVAPIAVAYMLYKGLADLFGFS